MMNEAFKKDNNPDFEPKSYSYIDRVVGGFLGVIAGLFIGALILVPPSLFYDFEGITIFFSMVLGSFICGLIGFIKPDVKIFATLYRVIFYPFL